VLIPKVMGIDHDFMTGKIEILEKQLEE